MVRESLSLSLLSSMLAKVVSSMAPIECGSRTDRISASAFIRSAKSAGFTLEEIAELLALDSGGDRPRAREMARERIAALDSKIAELQQARRSLSRLATECAAGGKGPCPIIAAFENA